MKRQILSFRFHLINNQILKLLTVLKVTVTYI